MIQNISNGYNNYQNYAIKQNNTVSAPIFRMQSQPTADAVQFTGQQKTENESFLSKHFGKILVGAAVVAGAVISHGKLWGKAEEVANKTVREEVVKTSTKTVSQPAANIHPAIKPKTAAEMMLESKIELPENLQKAWDEVIPQIADRGTEVGFLHDIETGEELLKTNQSIADGACMFDQVQIDKLRDESLQGNKQIAMIHNHPVETTFSSVDLLNFYANGFHTMSAVTRDGGYALLQRKGNALSNEAYNCAEENILRPYVTKEAELNLKLLRSGKNNQEIMENLNKWQNIQIPLIADMLNSSYHYTPGKPRHIASDEMVKAVEQHAGTLAKAYGLSEEEYLRQLDAIPLEQLLKPIFQG